MLDYKDIIIKHYALHMSGRQIAAAIGASKSGVNDFLKAFEQCESLSYVRRRKEEETSDSIPHAA